MREEEFRPVVGYEGYYEVSSLGRVVSCERTIKYRHKDKDRSRHLDRRELKSTVNGSGYLVIELFKEGYGKMTLVHILVAKAFIPNPNNKPEVNHKDGHPTNCEVNNLEWCTRSENALHAYRIGLQLPKGQKGENSPKAKLTEKDVLKIRELLNAVGHKKRTTFRGHIASQFNVSRSTIYSIERGKSWEHLL